MDSISLTRVEVLFEIDAPFYPTEPQITGCILEAGYTDETDIPKMIAISRGLLEHQIRVISFKEA